MPAYLDLLVLAVLVLVIVLFVLGLRRLLRRAMKQPTRESWLRWRTCTRKRAYSTRREAQVVVARHKREADTVAACQCRWCKRWHVGHSRSLRRG
jgi:hypothetical protein